MKFVKKFTTTGSQFRCYAASSERFPAVRKMRWDNYRDMVMDKPIVLPKGAAYCRIHASGDFYSQDYFDRWLTVCNQNPFVRFWAFTKSIQFWVNRLGCIPNNLRLQASYGSKQDHLIEKYQLKFARVFKTKAEALASGLPIDTDDTYAMMGKQPFALVDNFAKK